MFEIKKNNCTLKSYLENANDRKRKAKGSSEIEIIWKMAAGSWFLSFRCSYHHRRHRYWWMWTNYWSIRTYKRLIWIHCKIIWFFVSWRIHSACWTAWRSTGMVLKIKLISILSIENFESKCFYCEFRPRFYLKTPRSTVDRLLVQIQTVAKCSNQLILYSVIRKIYIKHIVIWNGDDSIEFYGMLFSDLTKVFV